SDGISIKRVSGGKVTTEVATVIDALPPPNGLALGSDGAAYVTTSFAGSVLRVDLHTRSVSTVARDLEMPTSILALPGGVLVVVETGAGRVLRLEPGGGQRVLASGLASPLGIARRGIEILTAEPVGGRVLVLHEGASPTLLAAGLNQPAGL